MKLEVILPALAIGIIGLSQSFWIGIYGMVAFGIGYSIAAVLEVKNDKIR